MTTYINVHSSSFCFTNALIVNDGVKVYLKLKHSFITLFSTNCFFNLIKLPTSFVLYFLYFWHKILPRWSSDRTKVLKHYTRWKLLSVKWLLKQPWSPLFQIILDLKKTSLVFILYLDDCALQADFRWGLFSVIYNLLPTSAVPTSHDQSCIRYRV